MELSSLEITQWISSFMWPFVRFGAMFMVAPFFGARNIPVRIRVILALTLALLVQPKLAAVPVAEFLGPGWVLLMVQQVLIGTMLGVILQVAFSAVVLAGQTIATSMGLGFASAVDPQNGIQVTMVGQLYTIIATLMFLAFNGHLALVEILALSFELAPLSIGAFSIDGLWEMVLWSGQMFAGAVLMSLPVVVGVLMVNLAFGIVTRAAPQLNIFAVGFPVTMLVGFVLMLVSISSLDSVLPALFENSFAFMHSTLLP